MFNFAQGDVEADSDSLELWIFTIAALALGLLMGYLLAGNKKPAAKTPQAPAKKAKK